MEPAGCARRAGVFAVNAQSFNAMDITKIIEAIQANRVRISDHADEEANEQNGWAVLITFYRPDPNLWINWRERRKKS